MALRIVYAGTPDFAVPALRALIDSPHEVAAVLTQPDRPAGRGKRLRASPVKQVAEAAGLPVLQPATLRDPAVLAELAALRPDVMVVAAYGLILPPEVLSLPRHGCLNLHASLLPRWRGAAPIQRALLAGDRETGITLMQMAEGLDTGDILLQRALPIAPDDTAGRLHDRLAALAAEVLLEGLERLQAGRLTATPQDEARATYAAKLSKAEAEIDWTRPAADILRQVRAFDPWPVAWTDSPLGVLRVWGAAPADEETRGATPGAVLAEAPEHGLLVAAGDGGALWITRLQLPGGRPLPAGEFLKARSLEGAVLGRG